MTELARFSGIDPASGKGRSLLVGDGVIKADEPCREEGLPLLAPGLVDLQINGYGGHDLNAGVLSASKVEALSQALCRVGVAAYLPTLITASEQDLCQRMSAIREAWQTLPLSAQMIAGIHVEGPSISSEDGPRGAHPAEHIRPPSSDEFEHWQDAAGGLIRLVTLAPESEGSAEYIHRLSSDGVCVALGHTNASEEEIITAVNAGASLSTHLGNGISSTLLRHPNAIWAQLAEDRLKASLILDGHHLPRSAARAMIRAKGVENVILVSDSVRFAGMSAGRYSSPIGGEVDVSDDGRVSITGTSYLAGSGSSLLDIVINFGRFCGLPFVNGLHMATSNPAALLGRSVALTPGHRADFILLDHDSSTGAATVRDIVFNGASVLR